MFQKINPIFLKKNKCQRWAVALFLSPCRPLYMQCVQNSASLGSPTGMDQFLKALRLAQALTGLVEFDIWMQRTMNIDPDHPLFLTS